ncbi:MAG TPA: flocculation-associated PEP-CTERM protein PepA [Gammaproteobacteria bacterium]
MNHALPKSLAILGAALISASAQAATTWVGTANYGVETVGPFDSYDFGVGVILLEAFSGTGGPTNPAAGDVFNGYLQSYVSGHSLGLTGVSASNLNITGSGTGYELTLRANFQETITNVTGTSVDFTIDSGSAEVYLDGSPDYSFVGDSGFSDGTAILNGSIVGGSGTVFGGVLGVTSIDVLITGYDTSVFHPDTIIAGSSVFTLQLTDGNNQFSGVSSVQGNSVDSGDFLLSADGNLTLAAVPVPAAVWLFGTGLLGLLGMARRRH